MKPTIRRTGYALGAEITGVDATKPLDSDTIAAIRQAWLDHVVVYLPGQNLSPEQFRAFCGSFGELDVENSRQHNVLGAVPEVTLRANLPLVIDGRQTARSSAAATWHTDHSETMSPTPLTFLLAHELPSIGGDTMFANAYTAYETLSPAYQRTIVPLLGVHDITLGQAYALRTPEQQAQTRKLKPPVVHPLVRVHPHTGRTTLYVADRIRHFVGMTEEESNPIRDYLLAHATRYENVYRHRWTQYDLIIWDNRCSLHYAVQDYDQTQLRSMLRASQVGPKTGYLLDAAANGAAANGAPVPAAAG